MNYLGWFDVSIIQISNKNSTMKTTMLKYVMVLFISLSTIFLSAQNNSGKYDLKLKYGEVNVQENLGRFIASFSIDNEEVYNGYYFKYIQFFEIPLLPDFENLESNGIVFIDFIPDYAYIIAIPSDFNIKKFNGYNIRCISPILKDYKLSPSLLDKDYPDWALRGNNEMDIIVSYYSTVSIDKVNLLKGGLIKEIIQEDKIAKTQIARVSIDDIHDIVALPYVSYVEAVYPVPEPENYTGTSLHRSNVINSEYSGGRHYDGTGVNVMLQDDGVIGPHIDYEGRIGYQYLTYNWGDHGDHVAGTICGAGNLDPKTEGMAPGAEIFTYGAAPSYPGFNLIPSHYSDPGIRISSTSYSNGCNAGYTSLARTMDIQIREYPALMHVFSAGNSGTSNCGYGAGPYWGNVTGGHKIGKNVITVANLDYKDALANSSSRGPAHDGRIKPDISAKGSSVYSTTDPNSYTTKSGTSMSCPGVSGSLAQLYHAYRDLNNNEDPKGGLIKAIVLNSADDLGNPGPDFKYGWGRINNLRAVELMEEYRYLTDEIGQGSGNTHAIQVPENVGQLKIMLYWTDREASVGTNKALVNDLDLIVTDPGSVDHFPWVLSSYPNPDSLDMPATTGIDHLNNMEQIVIDNPDNDTYTVSVDGFSVPMGPQEYFIVYEFVKNEVVVTYPLGGESFAPGAGVVVRWDTYGGSGSFLLEYSADNGQNWNTINDNIDGGQRYYNWSAPSEIGGSYIVRVSRNNLSGQSVESFSVMNVPGDLNFDQSCPNSAVISWNAVDGAESYEIYKLGEKYMELAGTTTETFIELDDVNAEYENWFGLKAVGAGNAVSQRSIANMKNSGIWECEFGTDLAVSDFISPPSGILYDCQDYFNVPVKIELTNTGVTDIQDIPVKFQFNNGTIVNENYDGVIVPGEVVIYEFNTSIGISSGNNNEVKAWIELDIDENSLNDVIESNIILNESEFLTANEVEDFDNIESCGWQSGCSSFICDLDLRWYNLENLFDDRIDWRSLSGITPTTNTGPIGDHTLGTIEGIFLYLEPTGDCFWKDAVLVSPCIDLGSLTNPVLKFWYNMHGENMGSLHLDLIGNGELIKNIMDPIEGDQGEGWQEAIIDLSGYSGQIINLRFRGKTGNGELSDLAIDDILVSGITGVGKITSIEGFSVYPNPARDVLNIVQNNFTDQKVISITIT
ncbi:MAG: hypothetical protein DRJ05_02830, partial [Bacteroidetes bacterium]